MKYNTKWDVTEIKTSHSLIAGIVETQDVASLQLQIKTIAKYDTIIT